MQYLKEVTIWIDLNNHQYNIRQHYITSEGWHQMECIKTIWFLDKVNWQLVLEIYTDDFEKKWFIINI